MSEHPAVADLGTIEFASVYTPRGTYRLLVGHYGNGCLAVQLFTADGQPEATLTVNLPDDPAPEGHVWIKNYAEGAGNLVGAQAAGIVGEIVRRTNVGPFEGSTAYLVPLLPRGLESGDCDARRRDDHGTADRCVLSAGHAGHHAWQRESAGSGGSDR